MPSQLLTNQAQLWKKHEKQLVDKRASFWEYIDLLVTIIKSGTYLEKYENQDQFLKTEADLSRSGFCKLQQSSETRKRLFTIVNSDVLDSTPVSHLHEYSKVEPGKQANVFAEVQSYCEAEGIEPTAKIVRKAVKPHLVKQPEGPTPDPPKPENVNCMFCGGSGKLDPTDPVFELQRIKNQELREAVQSWMVYKKERKEPYKSTGVKTLVSRILKLESQMGARQIMDSMERAMSNSWKGWEHDIGNGQTESTFEKNMRVPL